MTCDFCKKNKASVHLMSIFNDEVEKINICKECAKDFSFLSEDDFYNDLTKILFKIFQANASKNKTGRGKRVFKSLSYGKNKKCPNCNIDLKTIKKLGRMGCPDCYGEFRDILLPIIRSLHGDQEHKGKIPGNTSSEIKLEKSIRELRKRLNNEVIVENFEEAAKIRDRIKEMEKNVNE